MYYVQKTFLIAIIIRFIVLKYNHLCANHKIRILII